MAAELKTEVDMRLR